jgi:type IV pilus assembly protein PilY1
VTTCNPAAASVGNGYTATNCAALSGKKIQYTMTTTITSSAVSGGIPVGVPSFSSTTDPAADLDGVCYAPDAVAMALPTPNPQPAGVTAGPAPTAPCTTWPCTVATNTTDPRSINSLADVAQYYYVTDLRPAAGWPANISDDDVPAVGGGPEDDRVRWQHMTTFTIALGVSGTLQYRPDYKQGTATTGDFADIRSGVKNWPLWPDPALDYTNKNLWNDPKSIDDFWHTAVNGRGSFFSAANPTSVITGLSDALAGITARLASASGAGTSNLEPVAGDRYVYLANYTTQKWTGEVQAHEINLSDGTVDPTVIWSAQSLLDAKTGAACDARKVLLFRAGASANLTPFTWDTQVCDGTGLPTGPLLNGLNAAEKAHFTGTNIALLSQYTSMTDGTLATADQRSVAGGANLVNFLRGQRGLEGFVTNNAAKLYRSREHVLGDTVNGQPTYVRSPFAAYGDPGYAAFKLAQATRIPMLYVPANDGMLHAFYAGTTNVDPLGGKEAWAFVPSTVLPNLWKLADNNYKNLHQFTVDGTPSVSDVYDTAAATPQWKTILVAGLNAGGKGYYALDVTDPDNPKGLWEFKSNPAVCPATPDLAVGNSADCHLGYTFGKPLVTKIKDGTANGKWVVMVTSGYNNVNAPSTTGDGQGYLYVLDAISGQILYKISTAAGDAATPSGLAQINNFVDKAEIDNLTVRVYGTDVLGNIWRFDVNDTLSPAGREAALVGTAKDAGGTPQPITTRPEVSEIGGKPMIFVATGRLLGATDLEALASAQTQSIYGIIDPLIGTATAFTNLRSSLAPLALTQLGSGPGAYRTVACTGTTAQCSSTDGWFVNLPDTGERVNVEMKLRSGTLIVGSNVPQISACTTGGYSWLNYLNFSSGLAVSTSTHLAVSEYMSNSLIVGLTVVKLPDGTVKAIVTTSDANIHVTQPPLSSTTVNPKRVSWREVAR